MLSFNDFVVMVIFCVVSVVLIIEISYFFDVFSVVVFIWCFFKMVWWWVKLVMKINSWLVCIVYGWFFVMVEICLWMFLFVILMMEYVWIKLDVDVVCVFLISKVNVFFVKFLFLNFCIE